MTGSETTGGTAAPSASKGVILFDGICNLCNAWVRWVVERDKKGHFHFASLQSNAARRELERHLSEDGIQNLPDAIVLVDGNGVHTQSAAALRVARGLGFPWAILSVFLAVPALVRDAVYGFVARNRYRWFGHRDSCMIPTPEIAARFLDADEPPPPVTVRDPADVDTGERQWVRAWLVRLAVVYLLVYIAPFPLELLGLIPQLPLISEIPGLGTAFGWVIGLWSSVMNPIVSWTGDVVFGIETAPRLTGSGDQTFNYMELFVDGTLAVIGATVWTVVVKARRMSAITFDVSRVLARFYLGRYMLIYGGFKVFPLQMPMPGPDRLMQPIGDMSPMGIAWTFIGASVAYEIFLGIAELTAGYLLFWRRTALVGSCAAMVVMLNIMAINYFYDVPVKLFSTHLFLVAFFIAAPDLPRLLGLSVFNLSAAPNARQPYWRILGWSPRWAVLGTLVIVAGLTWSSVQGSMAAMRARGAWRDVPEQTGFYRVESFVHDSLVDRENEDDVRWVRVGLNLPFGAAIQRANGLVERGSVSFDLEEMTASFWPRGEQRPEEPQFAVTEPEAGVIRLEGTYDGKPTTIVLRKTEGPTLLIDRGFRWINEVPYNR